MAKVGYTCNTLHTSIYKAESDGEIEGYAADKCMALSALVLIAVHYSALHCSIVQCSAVFLQRIAVQCNTGQCRFHCQPPLNYLDSFCIGATIITRREIQCLP